MKYLFLFLLFITFLNLDAQSIFDKADDFFSKYVREGRVDYKAIKAEPRSLNELVQEIANYDLSNRRVTADFEKAFYINAYNILVIEQVVSVIPIYGPLKVEGFFNGIKHTVMGKEMTLDELEKDLLYRRFPDPRLHFVLVCAAKGCPPLASYSYQPEQLEDQLTTRTKAVLNLDWFIRVEGKKAELSQLFSWYAKDFGDAATFINKYRDQKIGSEMKISSYEYDWSLNDL
ncbi:MAG: hypothetical protein ACI83W_001349 [Marinoscillum sp.]|jgi:hypothetical protein